MQYCGVSYVNATPTFYFCGLFKIPTILFKADVSCSHVPIQQQNRDPVGYTTMSKCVNSFVVVLALVIVVV